MHLLNTWPNPSSRLGKVPKVTYFLSVYGNDNNQHSNNSCLDVSAVTLGDFAICWLSSDARCLNSSRILLAYLPVA